MQKYIHTHTTLQAAEHYYLITDPIPEVRPHWPVVEDPSSYAYLRREGAGMMVGLFEPWGAAWNVAGIPPDFSFGEIPPDWDRMAPHLERAMARVPRTLEAGVSNFFCGPESFTPDLQPIVGPAPELDNYWVAAGMNSIGILTGAGMGRLVAHWLMHGSADLDVTGIHIDRLHPYQGTPAFRAQRTPESLGKVYKCHYPHQLHTTARGAKQSPLHARTTSLGAAHRAVSGWEMPDVYALPDAAPPAGGAADGGAAAAAAAGGGGAWWAGVEGWGRPAFWDAWRREHQVVRESVGVIDMSFMSKLWVEGPEADKVLNAVSTADVAGSIGRVVYTQWLSPEGKMEADVTVTRLAPAAFLVVVTDGMHRHALAWLKRHAAARGGCCVVDVTDAFALLSVQGPRSRELLQQITVADMGAASMPFGASQEMPIGLAVVRCSRISYVGELGYELLVPSSQATHVWDQILRAQLPDGAVAAPVGLKALASLRLEKGYRDYGHDMDNTDSLHEVGLGFTCAWGKPGGFVGREAAWAQKAAGAAALPQRLAQILVKDPAVLLYHAEVVFRDGVAVGEVRGKAHQHERGCTHAKPHTHAHHHAHPHAHMRR